MIFSRNVAIASFKASVPVLLGYLAMGFAAGVLLAGKTHLNVFWAFFTSVLTVSGALQFLMVDWFFTAAPLVTVAFVTFSINLRYALYGLPLIDRWRNVPWYLKLYMIWGLTDETFALEVENHVPEGEDSFTYCFLITVFDHFYWVAGVIAGCLAGHLVTFNSAGIDFAMTALFIVILLDQLKEQGNRIPALVGAVSAVVGLAIYPKNMLIPSVAIILAVLLVLRKRLDNTQAAC